MHPIFKSLLRFSLLLSISAVLATGALAETDRVVLLSEVLDEGRILNVSLPADYSKDRSYPTIYLLDGGAEYAEYIASLMTGIEKNLIVVGVENTDRSRDMFPNPIAARDNRGGGGKNFLHFLTRELIPFIEDRYATDGYRILIGQSNSGFFTLYAMAHAESYYDGFLASSPMIGWDWEMISKDSRSLLEGRKGFAKALYMNCGGDDSKRTSEYLPRYAELLKEVAPADFRWMQEVIEGEGHVPDSGFARGLKFILQSR